MKMFIGGSWVESSSGTTLEKINPSTGKIIERFPAGTKADIDEAVDAAEEAFIKWSSIPSSSRSIILFKTIQLIINKRKELEDLLVLENGKIPKEAKEEVDGVIDEIQYYAEFAKKITGDVIEGPILNSRIFQYKVPYGVIAALTPWNYPAEMVARKLAPALITGNTVVLKPSSDTPLSAAWLVSKFVEAGIPKGVLNLVTGKGDEIGDYLVSHKKISLVTMTGSTKTGQKIMQDASKNMAKLILELGGKAPFIVWKDADIDEALKVLLWAKFSNSGQSCIAAERLYIHEDIYDKFLSKFSKATKELKVGDPLKSDLGPLINERAIRAMQNFVKYANEEGDKITVGGNRISSEGEFRDGYFFEPTIIEGVRQESDLFQEEIFGPIIPVGKVSDKEEMIRKANDSKYGLASYLFTSNVDLIFRAFEEIRFGELYVNISGPEAVQGYHTGFRLTGQGGEGSKYGIEEFLKIKNNYIRYWSAPS